MATILWGCYDGGGALPPSLGIAREIQARGHHVTFAARPEAVKRLRGTGFKAVEVTHAYTHRDRYPWSMFSYLTSPLVGEELVAIAAQERADAIVIDAMMSAALAAAADFRAPVAVMLHTFLHRSLDAWYDLFHEHSRVREAAGFGPLPSLDTLWGEPELMQVNLLPELDGAPRVSWSNIRHGGPVFEEDSRAEPLRLPWALDDPTPLVLVGFSTEHGQASIDKLQRSLDALAGLPVHGVATSATIAPGEVSVPDNCVVVPFASHEMLMSRAAAVISHGGPGTVMRALRHGLPNVVLIGKARDQDGIAHDQHQVGDLIDEHGIGRRLPVDAAAADISAAIREVLENPAVAASIAPLAERVRTSSGAQVAASNVLDLLSGRP